jgi:metal-responsive CopG/Arc/MetJ family transcriptional regulator
MMGSMKEKTSVTLSTEVLAGIDRLSGSRISRSAFIEGVLQRYLAAAERARSDKRELELMNKAADKLNAEMDDILDYQAPWE